MNINHAVIGLDFDNTLINYDELFYNLAGEEGLVPKDVEKTKTGIRDSIRLLGDGETKWQRLQASAYGPRMSGAVLNHGVNEFLGRCRSVKAKVHIVSHKTEFANLDETRTNLRQSAMDWMAEHGMFDHSDQGLTPGDVFFEQTRQEKLQRINNLGCTHFIDDLEEVLTEPSFPPNVIKILYAPHRETRPVAGVTVVSDWEQIGHLIFGVAQPHEVL